MIASHAMTPRRALMLAAAAELAGPLLLGTAVATAIGRGVVRAEAISLGLLIAALAAACLWGVAAARLGVPTSATHALIGGLVGAGLVAGGPGAIAWGGVGVIVAGLVLAPTIGLAGGYLLMRAVLVAGQYLTPAVNGHLRQLQVATSVLVAFGHGANDAQKGMGVIAAGLALGGSGDLVVPTWVVGACAATIALGVLLGGQRTLRTLGMRIYTIRPVHGFAAQTTTAATMLAASALGAPSSTVQVGVSAIFGAGAAERLTKVRWALAEGIVAAWLITLPASGALGAVLGAALGVLSSR